MENYLVLLCQVVIVWIDQHELTIVGHVVVLFHSQILLGQVQVYGITLYDKLWILMYIEWSEVVMLPLGRVLRVLEILNVLQLDFIVTWEYLGPGVIAPVLRTLENMRAEGINCDEAVVDTLLILLLNVCDILDGLGQVVHLATVLFYWLVSRIHAEHLQFFCLVCLLVV